MVCHNGKFKRFSSDPVILLLSSGKNIAAHTLGRGKNWDMHDNETLAQTWIQKSEDPIIGKVQIRSLFPVGIRRLFSCFPSQKTLLLGHKAHFVTQFS